MTQRGSRIDWKTVINNLDVPDLDGNKSQPEMETIKKSESTVDLERKVVAQRIVTEVYVYTDLGTQHFLPQVLQQVTTLGEMTKREFVELIADRRRKSK